jgi:hypothetical protein
MARQCAVCAHAQRSEIDAEIVSGQHHRTIARRRQISPPEGVGMRLKRSGENQMLELL